jgi:hydrogenase maturation protease
VSGDSFSETILVIGYGNVYRGDDGLGPAVAAAIEAMALPHVKSLAVHQLVPELCEELARVTFAVFVDAAVGLSENVEVTPIQPVSQAGVLGHVADPRSLLAFTQALYGRIPETWLVTAVGDQFDCGSGLSPIATANARLARERIIDLIQRQSEAMNTFANESIKQPTHRR